MTEINMKVLEMIKQNYTIDKICEELNISKKQLKRRIESIKNEGYIIKKMYGYGKVKDIYRFDKDPKNISDNIVLTNVSNFTQIKIMVISDTHIGHKKSNMDYIKLIYEYCSNNNIPIILHCGDLLDGYEDPKKSSINPKNQVEYLIKEYPCDSNINTFVVLGNHDESFIKTDKLDIRKIIEKQRDDMIPLGYNDGEMLIYDNSIHISHDCKFAHNAKLLLHGHSHRYKFDSRFKTPKITVPTLSDYLHTDDYPGAVEMSISISNKEFNLLKLKHLIINENKNIRKVSEIEYQFKKTL